MNVKILLIGDSNVGKSWYDVLFVFDRYSILMRFIDDKFNELSPTIGLLQYLSDIVGVDFKRKVMEVKDKKVRATIWDTGMKYNNWYYYSWTGTIPNINKQLLQGCTWHYIRFG